MLHHIQLVSQGNHKKDAQHAAHECQQQNAGDIRNTERIAEENQRRQGENHTGSDGFARRTRRLHDVVFEDSRSPQPLEDADGKHRDRNGGAHRQPGAQRQVDSDRPEDDAQQGAQDDCAQCEFGD